MLQQFEREVIPMMISGFLDQRHQKQRSRFSGVTASKDGWKSQRGWCHCPMTWEYWTSPKKVAIKKTIYLMDPNGWVMFNGWDLVFRQIPCTISVPKRSRWFHALVSWWLGFIFYNYLGSQLCFSEDIFPEQQPCKIFSTSSPPKVQCFQANRDGPGSNWAPQSVA